MSIQEIKDAVLDGKTVHWSSPAYTVIHCKIAGFLIKCSLNDNCIGLHGHGKYANNLNGKPEDFFIK